MKYKASENGVINYYFSLDNQETLNETEVLFHSGENNANFIKEFLTSNYSFITESTNLGLYVGKFYKENVEVELSYLEESYSGITVTYGEKR